MKRVLILITLLICSINSVAFAGLNVIKIPLQTSEISLDPSHIQDVSSLFVSRQINCQLVRNQGSIYKLEAAKSIKYISPLEIMIRINDDATFYDGTAVTANDVVASFNYTKKTRNVLRNMFLWVNKIDIIDNKTIIFKLVKPIPQFIRVLSSPHNAIFKKSFLILAEKNSLLWKNPIGCGGYKISTSNSHKLELIPIKTGIKISFYINKDNQLSVDALDQYDIGGLNIIGDTSKIENFQKVELFDPFQIYIGLNQTLPQWKEKSARCGFLSKIDTESILKAYANIARPANDFFPLGTLGYNKGENYFKATIELYENILPPKLKYFCLAYLTVSISNEYVDAYARTIMKIYPKVALKPIVDTRQFGKKFVKQKCDALIFDLKSNNLDGYEFLDIFANEDANFSGIMNAKLAQEIKNSQDDADPYTRVIEYRKLVEKIEDMCLIRPLLTTPMRIIYVCDTLIAPNIGLGALNDYYLGDVKEISL